MHEFLTYVFRTERRQYIEVEIKYDSTGSGKGKTSILEATRNKNYDNVAFVGSDVAFTDDEKKNNKTEYDKLFMFPTLAGYVFNHLFFFQ